jgi:hypothetical protein
MKVVKSVESYFLNAQQEARTVVLLSRMKSFNCGKERIVRMYEDFDFDGWYCLVFELLGQSLYDTIKGKKGNITHPVVICRYLK